MYLPTCRKYTLIACFLFLTSVLATDSFAQVSSTTTLELKKVGSSTVLPNMIFLETTQVRPVLSGVAASNAVVTIEINGVKNETTTSSSGTWEWASSQNLTGEELDLKISSGTQTKLFRLKLLGTASASNTSATSGLDESIATPSSSSASVFPQETPLSSPQTEEVVSEAPIVQDESNPLQAYLPFIIGGLGIGVILLLISRLLRPKSNPLPEPPLPQNSESPTGGVMPTLSTVPEPTPVTNTTSWAPSVPSVPEVTAPPLPETPNTISQTPEVLAPGTTVQPEQASPPLSDQPK